MNREHTVWPIGLIFLFACFLFAAFVVKVRFCVPVPAIDADRAAGRIKALAEIRAAESQALNQPGWIDQSRGLVRLPIDLAMQITEREWQNPSAARSNLTARAAAAAPPAAPAPPPGQPSAFK